jgi:hypothetical protein
MVKQVPALFLPKKGDNDKKATVKQNPKKRMFDKKQDQKKITKKGAVLLKV